MSAETTIHATTMTTSGHTVRRGAVLGGLAALAVNLAIWLIGHAGDPIRVVAGWAPDGADLTAAEVVIATVVAVGLGALLLAWMQRRGSRFRSWVIVALLSAFVSAIPLWRLEVGTGSKFALTCMHLVTGAATVVGQLVVRRRVRVEIV